MLSPWTPGRLAQKACHPHICNEYNINKFGWNSITVAADMLLFKLSIFVALVFFLISKKILLKETGLEY